MKPTTKQLAALRRSIRNGLAAELSTYDAIVSALKETGLSELGVQGDLGDDEIEIWNHADESCTQPLVAVYYNEDDQLEVG